ncbi:MAG: F0F1 ATP synthase subunit delta [Nocardioidaceae bacterium]
MPAASAQSRAQVVASVDDVVGDDPGTVGEDLFALVRLLDGSPSVRRALTEPAVAAEAKAALVHRLLDGKIGDPALQVAVVAVGQRWSHGRDLADSLEDAGVAAHLFAAEARGELDDVEDELFRFGRIAEAQPQLRDALSDRLAPVAAKRQLVDTLVEGRVRPSTRRLLDQVVVGRERSLGTALDKLQRAAAAYRDRLVATVWVAAALSEHEEQRLAAALQSHYGHAVHLNVIVDRDVLGGVRVRVNDDVIDSTVATRLTEVRRTFVR